MVCLTPLRHTRPVSVTRGFFSRWYRKVTGRVFRLKLGLGSVVEVSKARSIFRWKLGQPFGRKEFDDPLRDGIGAINVPLVLGATVNMRLRTPLLDRH